MRASHFLGAALVGWGMAAGAWAAPIGYAIASDGDLQLYSIDMATGVATAIGPSGMPSVESLTFGSTCTTLLGADDSTSQLASCSVATGACTAIGLLGASPSDTGLSFAADGNLYLSQDSPKNPWTFYSVNPGTGAATAIGDPGQEVTGLAGWTPTAGCPSGLYGMGGDARDNLVCMNTTTGAASVIGPLGLGGTGIQDGGIDFDASGILWGLDDTGRIFTINTTTGAATQVATTIAGFESLAICNGLLAPIPTPTPTPGVQPVPTLDGSAMVSLAVLLVIAGALALRRMRG